MVIASDGRMLLTLTRTSSPTLTRIVGPGKSSFIVTIGRSTQSGLRYDHATLNSYSLLSVAVRIRGNRTESSHARFGISETKKDRLDMGEDRGLGVRVKKEKEGFRRGRGDGRPVRKIFFDSKIYFAPRRIQLFIAPHRRNVLPSPEKDELPYKRLRERLL